MSKKEKSLALMIGVTFTLAFVLIVGVLFASLSNTSYSLPNVTPLPETILTSTPTGDDKVTAAGYKTINAYFNMEGGQRKHQLFCMESNVEYAANTELKRAETIKDTGLIYLATQLEKIKITKNTFGPGALAVGSEDAQAKLIETWLKQTAYWIYLAKIKAPNSDPALTDAKINELMSVKELTLTTSDIIQRPQGNTTALYSLIKTPEGLTLAQVIEKALEYNYAKSNALSLNVFSEGSSFTKDGEYYTSSKISVTASPYAADLSEIDNNYKLKVSAPEGTKVKVVKVDSNNEQITELLDINDLKTKEMNLQNVYYLLIPVNKVTNEKQTINVNAEGLAQTYTGYYYRGEGVQTVTTIDKVNLPITGTVSLDIVGAPDTNLSISKSIYLIGLIVLLTGVGILFINVNSKKQDQV